MYIFLSVGRVLPVTFSEAGFPSKRNARNEFTNSRKLQPIGTELSRFQLNSSF